MSYIENIARIKVVYDALEEMNEEVVFVGGATVSLYADRLTGEIRPTEDIDILIEVAHYIAFAKIEEKLRKKGFVNDMESGVICRYIVRGIVVDVMPTANKILGFANAWYKEGFACAMENKIDENRVIRIFKPEYFIATKLEAFNNRGKKDGRTSSDFEDIVFVLNSRSSIWKEMTEASSVLHTWLQKEFKNLLDNIYIEEWIDVHLDYQEKKRLNFIIGAMQKFVNS